jgi:hypothetical protein
LQTSLIAAKTKLNMTKVDEGLQQLNTSLAFTYSDTYERKQLACLVELDNRS